MLSYLYVLMIFFVSSCSEIGRVGFHVILQKGYTWIVDLLGAPLHLDVGNISSVMCGLQGVVWEGNTAKYSVLYSHLKMQG